MKSSFWLYLLSFLVLLVCSLSLIDTEPAELVHLAIDNVYEVDTAGLTNLGHQQVSNICEIDPAEETNLVYPRIDDFYETGGDGHRIALVNYNNTTDPTYAEVLAFIKADKTDEEVYDLESYICSDYAETVHNNAEKAGHKCAWIGVDFTGEGEHALNAFKTTDRGMIFIDCTGAYPYEPGNWDKVVRVQAGESYTPVALFREGYTYESVGTVKEIHTYW